ncbi:MAG: hypothetical protein HY650_00960 [Acidobacteria bacterium]|nr:hypothetical protein [Acidobacteriota bacterium]
MKKGLTAVAMFCSILVAGFLAMVPHLGLILAVTLQPNPEQLTILFWSFALALLIQIFLFAFNTSAQIILF